MVLSVFAGLLFFFTALIICALLLTKRDFSLEKLPIFLYILIPLSGFISSLAAGLAMREMKGLFAGLLSAALSCLILLLVLLLTNRMQLAAGHIFIFPLAILAGIPGGIIGANLR